jgi:hypothetical protein
VMDVRNEWSVSLNSYESGCTPVPRRTSGMCGHGQSHCMWLGGPKSRNDILVEWSASLTVHEALWGTESLWTNTGNCHRHTFC